MLLGYSVRPGLCYSLKKLGRHDPSDLLRLYSKLETTWGRRVHWETRGFCWAGFYNAVEVYSYHP
jgi:hypothetical protein